MAFAFTQQNRIDHQIRHIAQSQVGKALEASEAQTEDFDALVHGLRRRCKKLRGLVQLIAPHFDGAKTENAAFRDAARLLAGSRDAAVMVETFGAVLAFDRKTDGAIVADAAKDTGDWLKSRIGAAPDEKQQREMLAAFADIFRSAKGRVKDWDLSGGGFSLVGDGLERTYRQMRKGLAKAQDEGDAETLHEWRKHVKYHWHHVSLLLQAAPDMLAPRKAALDELGEMLGDHHNLAVLDQTLAEHGGDGVDAMRETIATLQKHLADDAFALGRQLVAEKPGMLRARFEQYWHLLPKKD